MELRQLRHLVLFAETGSVSEVAKLVYLTQPSVTRSLQSLEDEIGIEIELDQKVETIDDLDRFTQSKRG